MAVVAKRYAGALINIAVENNSVENYEKQLDSLYKAFSLKEVKDIIDYPGINVEKKIGIISSMFKDSYDKNVLNFMLLLIMKGRMDFLDEIVEEFKELAKEHKGVLVAEAISAVELNEDETNSIMEKIKKMYNAQRVELKKIVDPAVIGGIRLKIGDTVIDGTIKSKLENMKAAVRQSKLS